MADSYDLVVIGAGPGGYVAAIRAAQLGMKVACVDKRETFGGTCLNVGCIPSKALLNASEKYEEAQHHFDDFGIQLGSVKLDLKKMMAKKDDVVGNLTKGISFLFKKNKIDGFPGYSADIQSPTEVKITSDKESKILKAKKILIATGSEIAELPGIKVDEKQIVSSTGALSLPKVPKKLIVIGGGYIGLEMGSVWKRLGSDVTVVEFFDRVTPSMDGELSKHLQKVLTKQGINFKLGTKVLSSKKKGQSIELEVEDAKTGKKEKLSADIILVSIGRRPFTDNLGLEKIGVRTDNRGFIQVNDKFESSVPGVYAIGDVIPGPMLAHKAEEEGVICVEMMTGQAGHIDYNLVPGVVYTWPEVATVGKSEEQLKEEGIAYNVGKFPFQANSRARANSSEEGFVKILADKKTDRVLGVHMIGPDVGTMIAEAVAVMEFGGSSEDIARTCHAHPTLNEAMKEAALAVEKRAIHV